MTRDVDASKLKAISPHALAAYLKSLRWVDESPWGEYARRWTKTFDGRGVDVVLPTRATIADYSWRVAELLSDVSKAEGISSSQIINDVTLSLYDVLRVKAKASDAAGSISLEAGEELFESGRDLMLVAAAHEASGRADPDRRGRVHDLARDYMQRVRMGQTEHGSFVLTFLSPYSFEPIADMLDHPPEPFGRRVFERLGTALSAVEVALESSVSQGPKVFQEGVEAGISARLCRALGNIAERGNGAEISVGWSVQKPNDRVVRLALEREAAPVLLEAATILAVSNRAETVTINGTITNLAEEEKALEGRFKLAVQFGNRLRRVQAKFDAADRATVFAAFHAKKDFYISIAGELNKTTRPWTLENPREFQMVEFEASETVPIAPLLEG